MPNAVLYEFVLLAWIESEHQIAKNLKIAYNNKISSLSGSHLATFSLQGYHGDHIHLLFPDHLPEIFGCVG